MNARQLMNVIGEAQDNYIEDAIRTREGVVKPRRLSLKRSLLIAAVIALSLLLVGCGVVYLLSLQEMKIGEYTYTQRQRQIDETGLSIIETEIVREVISLQGLPNDPSAQAAKEWWEFEEAYIQNNGFPDPDKPFDAPSEYDAYSVFTQEMVDKVDEIAAKYGLELAGQIALFQREETEFFFDSLDLEPLHREDGQVTVNYDCGYFYECGNFCIEVHIAPTQESATWPQTSIGAFRYHDKDYFYTINSLVSTIDTCEQWNCTLSCGEDVLIVRDATNYAKVFCNREDAFLYLCFIDEYTDEKGNTVYMTNEEVQRAADAFDFTIKPQKPDMEPVNDYLDKAYAKAMAEQEARMETYVDPFSLESYREYVDYLISQMGNPTGWYSHLTPDTLYYTLLDFDGDGTEDFLYGGKERFGAVLTMKDGTIEPLFGNGLDSSLCENRVIDQSYTSEEENIDHYIFLQYADGSYTELHHIEHDLKTDTWSKVTFDDLGRLPQPITEAEARSILDSYKRIDLDMKPLSQFPSN